MVSSVSRRYSSLKLFYPSTITGGMQHSRIPVQVHGLVGTSNSQFLDQKLVCLDFATQRSDAYATCRIGFKNRRYRHPPSEQSTFADSSIKPPESDQIRQRIAITSKLNDIISDHPFINPLFFLGSFTMKVDPFPGWLRAVSIPPWVSTIRRHMARPMPVP